MNPRTTYQLLLGASLITVLGVTIQIFQLSQPDGPRPASVLLLLAFTVICIVGISYRHNEGFARGYLLVGMVTLVALFITNSQGRAYPAYEPMTLFFILTSCAALMLPLREAMLWIAGLFAIQMGAVAYLYGWATTLNGISTLGGHFMFAGFGYLMRTSNNARLETERLYSELQTAHAKLQEYTAQSQKLAVAEERNRLAREMHDSLGHRLTVAVLQLEGAQHLIHEEPERAATMVGNMRGQIKEALAELRRALSSLRDSNDQSGSGDEGIGDANDGKESGHYQHDQGANSLTDDIRQLVQTFQEATGLKIHVELPAELPDLAPAQRLALFRASQELLTNVQRHAVATEAWLALIKADGSICLSVADNGQGMPTQIDDGRFGLRGLGERAKQLNGTLEVKPRTEGGTQVVLSIPSDLEQEAVLALEGIRV